MGQQPLSAQLSAENLPLEYLFLDPNNPRFTGPDWEYVQDDEIHLPVHQNKAAQRLLKEFSADKLRINMEVNGYLPIDRIVVRKITDEIYIVLEGNRRVAAAKSIGPYSSDGQKISEEVVDSTKSIPCLVYTGDDSDAAWVFQGIRHITGINDWSSYNKAKLLVEQMDREELTLTDAGRKFGLSAYGAGQWVRGYRAFKQAKEETDYVTEIDERVYPYFQELFGRSSSAMKEWLEWNEGDRKFHNIANLNEFVGWFYPRTSLEDENLNGTSASGDWEKRIIGKQDDIRQLSWLRTMSPKYFEIFRSENDLEKAYSRARFDEIEKEQDKSSHLAEDSLSKIEISAKTLENLPISIIKNNDLNNRLNTLIERIENAIKVIRS